MDTEEKNENEPLDEQPIDESMEGVEDAQAQEQEDEHHVIPLKGMFENCFSTMPRMSFWNAPCLPSRTA
jgi:hypothetical protein